MLEEYLEKNDTVYKILNNSKNKHSHAYLFEANGNIESMKIVLSFVKYLFCPNNYSNNEHCRFCTQCIRIDNNNFPELVIINPDGMWIKKEQLLFLQKEFSKKSIESNKKIYIINESEKMNTQASNSILKFLEEPEENIVAILITNNIYQMLDTIVSRCQIISLKNQDKNGILNYSFQEKDNIEENMIDKTENLLKFIMSLEEKKIDTILFTQKLWHDHFKDRKDFQTALIIMIFYYKDVLNYKINRSLESFENKIEDIKIVADINSIKDITKKIDIINRLKEHLEVNANQSLLLDKLIIEITGGE